MKAFYDTNAVIDFLKGETDLLQGLDGFEQIFISVISVMEFFSFSELTQEDKELFSQFRNQVSILNISENDTMLIDRIADLRIKHRLKLPDAIILAQALNSSAQLITKDKELIKLNSLYSDS